MLNPLSPEPPALSEPVPITSDRADNSSQVVTLNAGEWTAYTINCDSKKQVYEIISRVKAGGASAEAQLLIDDEPCSLTLSNGGWNEVSLGRHPLSPGEHHLKWLVKNGTVSLDWLQLKAAKRSELSANRDTPGAE